MPTKRNASDTAEITHRPTRRRHPGSPQVSDSGSSARSAVRAAHLEQVVIDVQRKADADRDADRVEARAMEARVMDMIRNLGADAQAKDAQLAEASRVSDLFRAEAQEERSSAQRELHARDE